MPILRKTYTGPLLLSLAVAAACGSGSNDGESPQYAAGGFFGFGGAAASGGQLAASGSSGFAVGAGGSIQPGSGGSVAGVGGQASPGGGGSDTGGLPGFGSGGVGTGGVSGPGGFSGAGGTAMGGAMGDGGNAGAAGSGAQALPPITDYKQAGPFQTTTERNAGPGNAYTIFRPNPLGENGFVHSPIIFGPGIITTPTNYTALLTHLATHGFVTICANSLTGGPNAPANLQAMKDGLEWLIAQNAVAGTYQGKLAVNRAVTMGYSIGATASVQLSSHPAIVTTVAIHGHNTQGDPHGPVWLLTGTSDVIDDVRTTLATLTEAPAIMTALPIGHLNVLAELSATGRYYGPITAWLRYWVNGDDNAKHFFWGSNCDMCSSPWITPETNALWSGQTL